MPHESIPPEASRSGAASVPPPVRAAAAWSWRLLLIGLLAAAAVWIVATLKVIVVPIAVALLLSVLLLPMRRFLQHRLRFGSALAAGTSLVTLLVFLGGLIAIAGRSIATGVQDLSEQAAKGFDTFMAWLEAGPLGLDAEQLSTYLESLRDVVTKYQDQLVSGAMGAATTVGHVAAGALIALFCTFFFLHDGRTIWAWAVGLLPQAVRAPVHQAGRRGILTLAAYTRTQILVAATDAVGIGLGAAILQVPLALPLAILVFVGSFIPIVGAVVTGAVAVLVALVANGWVSALVMLGVVLVVQQLEGHVLQPFLMGHAVSLHPVAVLLVVTAGSFLGGIVGALFAVPVAAVINTVILYLCGHDKFPELEDDEQLVIRGRPVGVLVSRAEAELMDTVPSTAASAQEEPTTPLSGDPRPQTRRPRWPRRHR